LTAEREIACDDHALAISRAPRDYALFLTEFASQMKGRDFTAAPAAWSSNSQLKERIGMILNGKRNASPRVSRAGVGAISAAAVALAIAALAMTPRFVVAAEPPEAPELPEAPAAVNIQAAVEAAPGLAATITAPALPAAPSSSAVIAVGPGQPGGLTIASVSPPREKFDVPSPKINVNVAPVPVRITTPRVAQVSDSAPEPRRPKRVDRGDDDIERRLDRLEKMVEELVNHEKRKGAGPDRPGWDSNNFQYKPRPDGQPKAALPPDLDKQIHEQIEQAHREADRAKREAERAVREQKMAMDQHMLADRQREWAGQMKLNADRDSLKTRKHVLEEQVKALHKELEKLDKEIQKQDDEKRDKERDKRNKAEEKEKKTRDTGDKDSDDDNRKAK
jgi:hypothetical protein